MTLTTDLNQEHIQQIEQNKYKAENNKGKLRIKLFIHFTRLSAPMLQANDQRQPSAALSWFNSNIHTWRYPSKCLFLHKRIRWILSLSPSLYSLSHSTRVSQTPWHLHINRGLSRSNFHCLALFLHLSNCMLYSHSCLRIRHSTECNRDLYAYESMYGACQCTCWCAVESIRFAFSVRQSKVWRLSEQNNFSRTLCPKLCLSIARTFSIVYSGQQ